MAAGQPVPIPGLARLGVRESGPNLERIAVGGFRLVEAVRVVVHDAEVVVAVGQFLLVFGDLGEVTGQFPVDVRGLLRGLVGLGAPPVRPVPRMQVVVMDGQSIPVVGGILVLVGKGLDGGQGRLQGGFHLSFPVGLLVQCHQVVVADELVALVVGLIGVPGGQGLVPGQGFLVGRLGLVHLAGTRVPRAEVNIGFRQLGLILLLGGVFADQVGEDVPGPLIVSERVSSRAEFFR